MRKRLSARMMKKNLQNWQNGWGVHPLTCIYGHEHRDLVPFIRNDEAILKCRDCGWIQRQVDIPEIALDGRFVKMLYKSYRGIFHN